MQLLFEILLVLFTIHLGYSKKLPLPSYIQACRRSDPEIGKCCVEHGKLALPQLLKGDPKYGVPNFFPMKLKEIDLKTAGNLNIKLKDADIFGFDTSDIENIDINFDTGKIALDLGLSYATIIANYQMKGKILVIPLEGNGKCNLTFEGMHFKVNMNFKIINKNGEEYMEPEKPVVKCSVKGAHFYFENLFNGNEVLGKSTNQVLNDESAQVVEELKPALNEVIVTIAHNLITNFAAKVPYDEIFPK